MSEYSFYKNLSMGKNKKNSILAVSVNDLHYLHTIASKQHGQEVIVYHTKKSE